MKKIWLLMIVFLISASAYAQIETPVKWSYASKKLPGNEAVILLRASIQDGWHIYSLYMKSDGPVKTSFVFAPSTEYALIGKTTGPKPILKYEDALKMHIGYFEKTATFQQKIKIKSNKASVVKGRLEYAVCNDHRCLPAEDVDFAVNLVK